MSRESDSSNLNPQENWEKCRPGEIQELVTSLCHQRKAKSLTQAAVAGSTLLVLCSLTLFTISQFPGKDQGSATAHKVSCKEVIASAEDFIAGRLTHFVNGQIESHLGKCPKCQRYVSNLKIDLDSSKQPPPLLLIETDSQYNISWIENSDFVTTERFIASR